MRTITTFGSLLLLSTALVSPAAFAQTTPPISNPPTGTAEAQPDPAIDAAQDEEAVEVSAPGQFGEDQGAIVVTGRRIPNAIRATPQVVSVLSTEDIARTGEGDIAGALQRVTGLSVVGSGFVYVRGLGERYSLALLNGLPLPSPEPLRRVVPLDLFPTSILASTVVQKSYSVNYPGEFGGGVINLTTKSAPDEGFFEIGASIGGDTETTGQLGYTYFGSDTDFTSFDDETRQIPGQLNAAINSNNLIVVGNDFSEDQLKGITASLVNAPTTLIQRNNNIPANFGLNLAGGDSFAFGSDGTLGFIANLGFSNSWQTKGGIQQISGGATPVDGVDILNPDIDYRFLSTENRIVLNGLFGASVEWGEQLIRLTNLYIRDVIKEARIQAGVNQINVGSDPLNIGNTAWFERELLNTQAVGEFKFGDLGLNLRGTYANSRRESPYERSISYRFDAVADDFVNDLRTNGQSARIAFSELQDHVYNGGGDLGYQVPGIDLTLSAGINYYYNNRSSLRRDFRYTPLGALPLAVAQQRPDYLLSDFNIYTYDIVLTDVSGTAGVAAYDADLEVWSGFAQAEIEPVAGVRLQGGVRYEDGAQNVTPIDLFGLGGADIVPTRIDENYLLPAGTLTWTFTDDMQLRLSASKTIARPQFRELAPQQYLDIESDRTFFGNQFLTDSELFNAEVRYEYYFGRDQRLTLAGFYKDIENPIETVAFQQGGTFFTTFANAPKATLYGGEIEVQKYIPLERLSATGFFAPRRLVLIGNYTYSESELKVGPDDETVFVGSGGVPQPATDVFIDGTPLTGQSKHLANLQIGLENTDRLSQQTLLLTYASKRVTNRGPSGQPDLIEEPGVRLDFVWREGISLAGRDVEVKFEARNLLGENYEEFQTLNGSRIDNNSYDLGRSFSLGASMAF